MFSYTFDFSDIFSKLELLASYKYFQILVLFILFLLPFVLYFPVLTTPTDINEYGKNYSLSQYVLGENSPQKISDGDLYIYAGYAYLKGEDPTTINFEHPPLGKYFFGLSQLLTGNSIVINWIFYFFSLWVLFLLTKKILVLNSLRLLTVILFGTIPVVYSLSAMALLDIPLLLSMLLFFLASTWKTQKLVLKYFLAGLVLGTLASIKYPFPFIGIPVLMLVIISFLQKENRYIFLSFTTAGIVYLVQYAMFFAHGHSLLDWVAFEKYRFSWWTGERTMPKFLIFENIFTGRHEAWWEPGTFVTTKEWTPTLPILLLLTIAAIPWMKRTRWNLLFFSYSIVTLFLFAFGSAAALRYLVIVIPFWIIAFLSAVEKTLLDSKKVFKLSPRLLTKSS